MPQDFDFGQYITTTQKVVVGIVSIALAGGIGSYILAQFNNGTGGQISQWVNLLNVTMISTVVTILIVAVIAFIGIGLIKLMTKTTE